MLFKSLFSSALLASAVVAQNSNSNNKNLTQLISQTSELSALGSLLSSYPSIASEVASMKNVTLLAPNNFAIAALGTALLRSASEAEIKALLSYHVLQGEIRSSDLSKLPVFAPTMLNSSNYANVTGGQVVEAQTSNGSDVTITSGLKIPSTVVTANVRYDNGIVHIINRVLTIPEDVSTTAVAAGLSALAGAATEADLVTALDTTSDITVFAPTNAAFAAIGSAVGNLSKKELTSILEYHVLNGTVAYSTLLANESVTTLGGKKVNVKVEDGAVFVNAARVINADILISGGVLHVIDSVLNPDDTNIKPKPNANSAVVQFSSVSSASIGALTSGVPAASTTVRALTSTTADVAQGYPTRKSGSGGSGGGSGGSGTTTTSGIAAMPTGMMGAAALFGGVAMLANY